MAELEQHGKHWFWEPIYGKSYPMLHTNEEMTGPYNKIVTDAVYFGNNGEEPVFLTEKHGEVLAFTADLSYPAIWLTESDDSGMPVVWAEKKGRIEGREKTYALEVLARHAKKRFNT